MANTFLRGKTFGFTKQIGILLSQQPQQQFVRSASKKTGSSSRNKVGSTPGKSRGWKKLEGSFVHQGEVLVKQLGLRYYPGENVGMERDKTLVALLDGKVMVSFEQLNPFPDSPLHQPVKQGVVIQKKFVHVLPIPLHAKFRLISQV